MFLYFLVVVLQELVHSAPEEETKETHTTHFPLFSLTFSASLINLFSLQLRTTSDPRLLPQLQNIDT